MKQIVFSVIAATLFAATGYAEEGQSLLGSASKLANSSKESLLTAKDKVAEVSQQAEAIKEKAGEVMKSFNVKAEDVMADLNLPIKELKAKVATFDQAQVLGYVTQYKDVILAKKDELMGATASLKELPFTKKFGAQGRALKKQLSGYKSELSGLKDRYGVYLDQLKAFGVDLSAYGL